MKIIPNLIANAFNRKLKIVVPGKSPIEGSTDILIETLKFDFTEVLDIGLGQGSGSHFFLQNNKKVTATGYDIDSYNLPEMVKQKTKIHENVNVENMSIFEDGSFDAVWCSHVIEHCFNTGKALQEIKRLLRKDGYLFLSVPPFKHNVVGGHINVGWNIGLLMYVLCLNGFDSINGSFISHGYNVSAFVKPNNLELPKLRYDEGDIETLVKAGFLPDFFHQNVDGSMINGYQWSWCDRSKIKLVYA